MALLQPARIRILAIGKLKRAWVAEGVTFYRKRLPGLQVVELKDSTPAKEAEAKAVKAQAEASGATPAVDNAYLRKIDDGRESGAGFYVHVDGLLRRFFDLFGEEHDQEGGPSSQGEGG